MAKSNVISQPVTFVKQAREELRKVSWPSREQTVRYTLVVLVASVGVGLVIGFVDYLFSLLIEKLVL